MKKKKKKKECSGPLGTGHPLGDFSQHSTSYLSKPLNVHLCLLPCCLPHRPAHTPPERTHLREPSPSGRAALPVFLACINRGEFCKALSTSSEVKCGRGATKQNSNVKMKKERESPSLKRKKEEEEKHLPLPPTTAAWQSLPA